MTVTREESLARAFECVPTVLSDLLTERIRAGHWLDALLLASSQNRIALAIDLLPAVPVLEQPTVMANAISDGDNPRLCRDALIYILRIFRTRKTLAFDCDAARDAFDKLPKTLTIYRGTTEAEGYLYGVCWTLDREKAIWFATKHMRFRNFDSPPVLLTATVRRRDVCGYMTDREEQEILITPDRLQNVERIPL